MKNWSLAYWQWLIFYYRLTSKCISFLRWWKSPVPWKITQTSRILTYQKIGFSCQHYLQFSVPGGAGMWGLHFLGEDLAVWHTLTSSWWEAKGAAAKASTYFSLTWKIWTKVLLMKAGRRCSVGVVQFPEEGRRCSAALQGLRGRATVLALHFLTDALYETYLYI